MKEMFSMYYVKWDASQKMVHFEKKLTYSQALQISIVVTFMFGGTDTNIYLCGLKDPENIMKHHTGV